MTNDPASLQNLHDIVVPPPVSFWPPAPGWYLVAGLLLLLILVLLLRVVIRYRRNAYRRAALAKLASASSLPQIATLLKRVALAAYPRTQVASLTGDAWLNWLAESSGLSIPAPVAVALTRGVYAGADVADISPVTGFAADWIRRHKGAPPC